MFKPTHSHPYAHSKQQKKIHTKAEWINDEVSHNMRKSNRISTCSCNYKMKTEREKKYNNLTASNYD